MIRLNVDFTIGPKYNHNYTDLYIISGQGCMMVRSSCAPALVKMQASL